MMSSNDSFIQTSSSGSQCLAALPPTDNTAFTYQTLERNQIRLLQIITTDNADSNCPQMQCSLQHFESDSAPPYYALSYLWGDSNERKPININEIPFDVTENLFDALFRLQKYEADLKKSIQEESSLASDIELYFWVDAVCINQNDASEKSFLVPKMGQIFGCAFNVLVWLHDKKTNRGDVSSLRNTMQTAVDQLATHEENALAIARIPMLLFAGSIAHCPWFRRVWVIQEYALARRTPQVYLTNSTMHLEDFRSILLRLRAAETGAQDVPLAGQAYVGILDELLNLTSSTSEMFRPAAFQHLSLAGRLEYVILRKGTKQCKLYHDHIYAFLGLVGATDLPPSLTPNYAVPFREIAEPYSRYIFSQTGSLALLDNRFLQRISTTPSWVSDFQPKYVFPSDFQLAKRQDHIEFVNGGKELVVDGVIIGKVKLHTQPVSSGLSKAAVVESRLVYFYDTILAEKAKLLQVPHADLWKSSLESFGSIIGAKLEYDTITAFIEALNDQPHEKNRYAKMIADFFFTTYGYALLDTGDILYYWPPERDFGHGEHIVVMFAGAVSYTILEQLDHGKNQCVVQAQHIDDLLLRPRPYNFTADWFESKESRRFTLV